MDVNMKIKIEITVDENLITNFVDEANNNESLFIREFSEEILSKIGLQTVSIIKEIKNINKINSRGIIL